MIVHHILSLVVILLHMLGAALNWTVIRLMSKLPWMKKRSLNDFIIVLQSWVTLCYAITNMPIRLGLEFTYNSQCYQESSNVISMSHPITYNIDMPHTSVSSTRVFKSSDNITSTIVFYNCSTIMDCYHFLDEDLWKSDEYINYSEPIKDYRYIEDTNIPCQNKMEFPISRSIRSMILVDYNNTDIIMITIVI